MSKEKTYTRNILRINPEKKLQFPFNLKKATGCYLNLTNHTNNNVAFMVTTTNPANYFARPNSGIVLPRSTCEVRVIALAQKDASSHMQSNEMCIIQSVLVNPEVTAKEVTLEMFSKETGKQVDEDKLKITYTFESCTCL